MMTTACKLSAFILAFVWTASRVTVGASAEGVETSNGNASSHAHYSHFPLGLRDPVNLGHWVRGGEYCGSTLNAFALGHFHLWKQYYIGVAPMPAPFGCCEGSRNYNGVTKYCKGHERQFNTTSWIITEATDTTAGWTATFHPDGSLKQFRNATTTLNYDAGTIVFPGSHLNQHRVFTFHTDSDRGRIPLPSQFQRRYPYLRATGAFGEVCTPKIAEGKDVYEACLEAAQSPDATFRVAILPITWTTGANHVNKTRLRAGVSGEGSVARYLKDVSFGLAPNVVFDVLDPVQANLPEWINADALDNATTHEWGDSYKYVSVTAPDGTRVHGVVVSKDPNGGGFWCPRLSNLAKQRLGNLPVASLGAFSAPSTKYERVIFLAQNQKCVHSAGMNSYQVRNGWNNATGDAYPYSILMGVQPNASYFQSRPSRPSRLSWQYESDHPMQYSHPLGNWGSTSTILHELIHAMGVQRHAERYDCDVRNAAKLDSGSCTVASSPCWAAASSGAVL